MTKILCIANQKGGVGKTTTTLNLAAGLAKMQERVCLIDFHPQRNATMGAGVDKSTLQPSIYQVLLGFSEAGTVRQKAACNSFDVLPANRELAGAEVDLIEFENRENRLK